MLFRKLSFVSHGWSHEYEGKIGRQNDPEQVSEAPKRANKKKGKKFFKLNLCCYGALVFIDVIFVQTWEKIDFYILSSSLECVFVCAYLK